VPPSVPASTREKRRPSLHSVPWLDGETADPSGNTGDGDTSSVQRRRAAVPPTVPITMPHETIYFSTVHDSDPPMSTQPVAGQTVGGRFLLERPLVRGGMGSLWRGRDQKLDIDVAIKFVRADRTDSTSEQRMIQEARAAARIGHPSIVRVFDFGVTEAKEPFIVMELLQGESLGAIVDREGPLDPTAAVATLLPIASALVATHAKNIVHRDLKPDNVVIVSDATSACVPKLVDFGIARLLVGGMQQERFTETGVVMGSPNYMSPEQICGNADIDAATDIWAFSVMLYVCITGRLPFYAPNRNALMFAIVNSEPMPIMNLGVKDAKLWAIVRRGLAKEAADRWPSMRHLGAELAAWLLERGMKHDVAGTSLAHQWLNENQPPSDAPLSSSRPARRQLVLAALVAFASLIALVAAAHHLRSAARRPSEAQDAASASGDAYGPPPPAEDPGAGQEPAPAESGDLPGSLPAKRSQGITDAPRAPGRSKVPDAFDAPDAPDINLER
jgi:eukaryotic-like serine/threonine-protein kinase